MFFLVMCFTEFYFMHKYDKELEKKGKIRYIDLKEAIPNYKQPIDNQGKKWNSLALNLLDNNSLEADQNGFILPSFEQPNSDISIIFLGDGSIVSSHLNGKNRLHHQTGQMLSNKTKFRINTYNAG